MPNRSTGATTRFEGKLEYTSLLYVPKKAPYDLWHRDGARGLKLYVQRIFIMDDAEQFLPLYLRFIKGVVDSNDISLNVSREILQQDPVVDSMKSALTKRALDMLEKLKKKEPETYQEFWSQFGNVLKEGPSEDNANKEKIAKLLLFASTHSNDAKQTQSLEDYVGRMKPEQKKIYYIASENHNTAKNSPHLEVIRKKGIEVLLLSDRVDEWLMSYLLEFDGKSLQDVTKGELDLGELDTAEEKEQHKAADEQAKPFLDRIQAALGERVSEVRVTHRLTDSPACLAVGEHDMGAQMRKIMEAAGQKVPETKPVFELNTEHPLVQKLDHEQDEGRFGELASILFDQACLAEGRQLEDPAAYIGTLEQTAAGSEQISRFLPRGVALATPCSSYTMLRPPHPPEHNNEKASPLTGTVSGLCPEHLRGQRAIRNPRRHPGPYRTRRSGGRSS